MSGRHGQFTSLILLSVSFNKYSNLYSSRCNSSIWVCYSGFRSLATRLLACTRCSTAAAP